MQPTGYRPRTVHTEDGIIQERVRTPFNEVLAPFSLVHVIMSCDLRPTNEMDGIHAGVTHHRLRVFHSQPIIIFHDVALTYRQLGHGDTNLIVTPLQADMWFLVFSQQNRSTFCIM